MPTQASNIFIAGDPSDNPTIPIIERNDPPGNTWLNIPTKFAGIHSFCKSLQLDLHDCNGWHVSEHRGKIVSQISVLNFGKHLSNIALCLAGTSPILLTIDNNDISLSLPCLNVFNEKPGAIDP